MVKNKRTDFHFWEDGVDVILSTYPTHFLEIITTKQSQRDSNKESDLWGPSGSREWFGGEILDFLYALHISDLELKKPACLERAMGQKQTNNKQTKNNPVCLVQEIENVKTIMRENIWK